MMRTAALLGLDPSLRPIGPPKKLVEMENVRIFMFVLCSLRQEERMAA